MPVTVPMHPDYVLVDLFAGRVAAVECSRTAAIITINSWVELLQRVMPRNIFSSSCRWTLFDGGCTLDRASFSVNVTVNSVVSDTTFGVTGPLTAQGYFALGMATYTSGANTPFSRSILADAGPPSYTLTMRTPFPYQVSAGDRLMLYPGCDKTQATCTSVFNNLANFGGFPYIPNPESAT
jgi:uncharacterized phage protein (TIGR02218 family)